MLDDRKEYKETDIDSIKNFIRDKLREYINNVNKKGIKFFIYEPILEVFINYISYDILVDISMKRMLISDSILKYDFSDNMLCRIINLFKIKYKSYVSKKILVDISLNVGINNVNNDLLLLRGSKIKDDSNNQYYINNDYICYKNVMKINNVLLYDGNYVEKEFVSNGLYNECFEIDVSNGLYMDMSLFSVRLKRNNILYVCYEYNDIFSNDDKYYYTIEYGLNKIKVVFGDGYTTKKLEKGDIVIISYLVNNSSKEVKLEDFSDMVVVDKVTMNVVNVVKYEVSNIRIYEDDNLIYDYYSDVIRDYFNNKKYVWSINNFKNLLESHPLVMSANLYKYDNNDVYFCIKHIDKDYVDNVDIDIFLKYMYKNCNLPINLKFYIRNVVYVYFDIDVDIYFDENENVLNKVVVRYELSVKLSDFFMKKKSLNNVFSNIYAKDIGNILKDYRYNYSIKIYNYMVDNDFDIILNKYFGDISLYKDVELNNVFKLVNSYVNYNVMNMYFVLNNGYIYNVGEVYYGNKFVSISKFGNFLDIEIDKSGNINKFKIKYMYFRNKDVVNGVEMILFDLIKSVKSIYVVCGTKSGIDCISTNNLTVFMKKNINVNIK